MSAAAIKTDLTSRSGIQYLAARIQFRKTSFPVSISISFSGVPSEKEGGVEVQSKKRLFFSISISFLLSVSPPRERARNRGGRGEGETTPQAVP